MSEEPSPLQRSVSDLTEELKTTNITIRDRTAVLWFAVAIGGLLLLLLIFAGYRSLVQQTASIERQQDAISEAIAKSNRRWCPIIEPLVPRPGDPPPTDERAARIRKEFTALARDFGCIDGEQRAVFP